MNVEIENYKEEILGLPISHVWRGHGSAIFIEIGPILKEKKRNNPRGKYSVMLDCGWRVEDQNEISCGSFNEYDEIESYISKLVGESISDIQLFGALPEIEISLSSGKKVLSFTIISGDPEWGLFLPNSLCLGSKNGNLVLENTKPQTGTA